MLVGKFSIVELHIGKLLIGILYTIGKLPIWKWYTMGKLLTEKLYAIGTLPIGKLWEITYRGIASIYGHIHLYKYHNTRPRRRFCYEEEIMAMNFTKSEDALTELVDRLSDTAPLFPTVEDFNTGLASESALKWKDLTQDTIYQILTAQSVNTQDGTTFILSLQTADGFCYSAWACGILTKEILQNHMMLEDKSLRLFVRPTGPKTSKNGRIYYSCQLLRC